MKEEKVSKVGQVFTPAWVARLIVNMCITNATDTVLDPCFGRGIFIKVALERLAALNNTLPDKVVDHISGMELDPFLFSTGADDLCKELNLKRVILKNLTNENFFEAAVAQFDVVVMNPPYVRSEQLNNQKFNFLNREKIAERALTLSSGDKLEISARSNLYLYFIIHSEKFIKDGGVIGAILPNTWLDSNFGKKLQYFLLDNFHLEYVIDFDKDSFDEVYVEECIIIARKEKSLSERFTKFVHLENRLSVDEILKKLDSFDNIDDDVQITSVSDSTLRKETKWRSFLRDPKDLISSVGDKLVSLSQIAKVYRGLTTGNNDFFMLNENKFAEFSFAEGLVKNIIASPHDLVSFRTDDAKIRKILNIDKRLDEFDPSARTLISAYIDRYLKRKSGPPKRREWYVTGRLKTAPIIFSYIIRRQKSFVLNSPAFSVRDNFYCINPVEIDPLLLFGILNSTITKIMLESLGRSYGGGLLKIQVYELKELRIPDPRMMDKNTIDSIIKASENLSKCDLESEEKSKFITEIDKYILKFLSIGVTTDLLSSIERNIVEKRINRDNHRMVEVWRES